MGTRSSSAGPENRFERFLRKRLGLGALLDLGKRKTVPVHKHSFWYYWGGMVLFLFALQIVTGILLLLYYRPSANEAYESVQFILTQVRWGWLIRSLHSISSNLLILALFLHMSSAYFMRAYRAPREATWVSGVVLFFLFITFGFSGYLLPWNELAFAATSVGTEILGAVPFIGDFLIRMVRGGDEVTGATLSRFYGLHVAVLPAITTIVLALHLHLVQNHGMSIPRGVREKGPPVPFVPNFLLRDMIGWFTALGVLIALIVLGPTAPQGVLFPFDFLFDPEHLLALGDKADPFSSAGPGIKPEWYFLFMYQALKMIPAFVLGIEGETLGALAFGVGGLVLVLIPFLDRGASDLAPTRLSRAIGTLIVTLGLALAGVGTWSMWVADLPLGVAGGLGAVAWIVVSVLADRRRPAEAPSLLFPSLGWLTLLFIAVMTIVGRLT